MSHEHHVFRNPPPAAPGEVRLALDRGELIGAMDAMVGAVMYGGGVRLVERGREPGSRHDFCRIHEHTWSRFVSQSDPMLARTQAGAAEGVAVLGLDSAAGRRMDETRRFFAFVRDEIKQSMEKWQRLQAAESEAG